MLNLQTLGGFSCPTPSSIEEDNTPRFSTTDPPSSILEFYNDNGFVIIKNCLSINNCDCLRFFWNTEVKTSDQHIYRQQTAKLEKNKFNESCFIMNPILNIQSLSPKHFGGLRNAFREIILENTRLFKVSQMLLGDIPLVVQSMYFEGNSVTWEHQDSYYLDGENIGSMFGSWIALEDIDPTAGRFFVIPKSHLIDYSSMDSANNIAFNHSIYKQHIVNSIEQHNLEVIAPVMQKGDVLFWNSLTIHGSLNTSNLKKSRNSITFHAIPTSSKFRVLRTHLRTIKFTSSTAGFNIFAPKDQRLLAPRALFYLERSFSKQYYSIKAFIIFLFSLKLFR